MTLAIEVLNLPQPASYISYRIDGRGAVCIPLSIEIEIKIQPLCNGLHEFPPGPR